VNVGRSCAPAGDATCASTNTRQQATGDVVFSQVRGLLVMCVRSRRILAQLTEARVVEDR
jgi:hypothetical protein